MKTKSTLLITIFFIILTTSVFAETNCSRKISVIRTIPKPHFVYTGNLNKPLRIEIRSKDTFDQLGLQNQSVDFSHEEVFILGFLRKLPAGQTVQVKSLSVRGGEVLFETEIEYPPPGIRFNASRIYPLVTVVIPRQEKPLPSFQTNLPVKGGFYIQHFYWHSGDIDIEEIKHKIEELGIQKEGKKWFAPRKYEVISYIRLTGQKFPRAVSFLYPSGHIAIGPTSATFSDRDIVLPEMTHESAVNHLAHSLILPLFDVTEAEAKDWADEYIRNGGRYTFRDTWQKPPEFYEKRFRKANNLPLISDFSMFRRTDINDYHDTFTESSRQAHLRVHLARVAFRRRIEGIATYIIDIAEHGRMSIKIVDIEQSLSKELLTQGFTQALEGLVKGEIDKERFHPVYGYSDSDSLFPCI